MRSTRNALALAVLLASPTWMSCSGGGGGGEAVPDTTPPSVTTTSPADGAASIPTDAPITATFDEAVDPATVTSSSFTLTGGGGPVAGTVAYDGPTRTATFTPAGELAASTSYTASVSDVEDGSGNPMAGPHQWSFETAAPGAGDLDPAFGTAGVVRTDVGTAYDEAHGMAIQPDDKIVVAGGNGTGAFTVARYGADGTLDPTFGPDGIVTTKFSGCNGFARAVTVQGDGKIVAAGTCGGFSEYDVTLVRYEADGTLDPTFGASGIRRLTLTGVQTADAVAVDGSGNVVVAGTTDLNETATNGSDFLVARFTPAGDLDPTFSTDGLAFVDFEPGAYGGLSPLDDEAYGLAIRGDGGIVVAGRAENAGWLFEVALAALTPNGTVQARATTAFGKLSHNSARAVALEPDGDAVVAGMLDYDFLGVMRFTSSLSADVLFGVAGAVEVEMRTDTSTSDYAYGVMVQPDGKIVAAGRARSSYSPYPQDFALVRTLSNGALDSSFGKGGKVVLDGGAADDVLIGVGRQSDGKIVAAGTSGGDFVVLRFLP